jgi:hypothetical protein
MNNWCICWFFTHILLGILIFKGLTVRRPYKSFGVKRLTITLSECVVEHVNNITHVPAYTMTQYAFQNIRILEVNRLY